MIAPQTDKESVPSPGTQSPGTPQPGTQSREESVKLLKDTAQAVKVMKASWLHVALNLKRIREHQAWRLSTPACESFESYVFDVLKLNKYVARRMLRAMEYTEEHRPQLIQDFEKRGNEVEVPSYDVVNQLRRVESSFGDREDELRELHTRVFDEGVGRVTLKRDIDERLARMDTGESKLARVKDPDAELADVIGNLESIGNRLQQLSVPEKAHSLLEELLNTLKKVTSPAENIS